MPALQIYEGEVEPWLMSDYCTDTVPVLLRRATFCRAFAADAKDFRSYNSWVRSHHFSTIATVHYIGPGNCFGSPFLVLRRSKPQSRIACPQHPEH